MQKSMIKYVSVADLITLLNAVFGFFAVIMLFLGEIRIGFSLILLALLADGLDGIVARKFGVGKIGDYLESMADMTSMSIAPMAFVFVMYYEQFTNDFFYLLFLAVLIIFLICSLIRLSSFHILKDKDFFIGLPASASTIYIIFISNMQIEVFYTMILIFVISMVMISKVRFPKLDFKISTIATILIFLTIILYDTYFNIASFLLLAFLTIYVIIGPIYVKYKEKKI